jgi:cytochrome c biogenesis protein CcdA
LGDLARIGRGGAAISGRSQTVSAFAALIGAVLTFVAVTIGAFLFVVFAATLALMVLLAALLIGLAALTSSSRPRRSVFKRGTSGVLSLAPPPAHAWVAYQWDRPRA